MESRKSIKTYYGFLLIKKINGTICGRFPVTKKECSLGRSNNCDIKILLENVSAIHCIILCTNDKAYLRDKSNVGSTKVNGKKVGRNNYLLHHQDEIEICGRKFIWEYFNLQHIRESNSFSGKKSGIKNEWTTPRVRERSSNQLNIPLVSKDDNKISTPAKSSLKTSKTILSINKTPIVVASANMSKSSFDELKNSLKKQNSTQFKLEETTSCSMVSGQNIPLINIGGSTVAQRKSWIVTNSSDDNSSPRGPDVLNKLSSERLKRDSTPEFNSSYHYKDEDIEFDSPESPCIVPSDKHTTNATDLEQSESANDQNDQDDDLSFCNSLPNSEIEPSSTRRDTYCIDNRPLVVEQSITSTPKRSILKSSKTAKAHRAHSSSRMVQFARLPKTDSKVKLKNQFKSKSNSIVTDTESNETEHTQGYKKGMQFNDDEYDDDLDGVQPLDASVSSLINSPILEHININRSAIRGSRGNKVMSLVNSLEKRIKESPKHSLRASDLLSINSSKGELLNDSLNNTNIMQESTSSRRINLEDIFVAEDSLKQTSCTIENETSKDINKKSVQNTEISSNLEVDLLNKTETERMSIDVQNNDLSENECEYTFTSPLNLNPELTSSTITGNVSTFVDIKNDSNLKKKIDNQYKTKKDYDALNVSLNLEGSNSKKFTIKSSIITNKIENISPVHELSNISNLDNINVVKKNQNQTINKKISNDVIRTPINNSKLALEIDDDANLTEKSTIEDRLDKQNNDSEIVKKSEDGEEEIDDDENDVSNLVKVSTVEDTLDKQNNDSETVEKLTDEEEEINDVSNLVEQSTIEDQTEKQNNDSETVEKSTDEEGIVDNENVSNLVKQSTVEDTLDKQNNDTENVEKSTDEGEEINDDENGVSNLVEQSTLEVQTDKENNDSEIVEKSTDEEEEEINDDENGVSNLVEQSTLEVQTDKENNDSEIVEKSINEEEKMEDDQKGVSNLGEKSALEDEVDVQNNDSESIEESTEKETEQEQLDNVSKHVEQTSEEGPSMVVQCISDMFNANVDEHEPTSCHNEDDIAESYVLVETEVHKSTQGKKSKKQYNTLSKEYQSVFKNVEKQLSEIHNPNTNENAFVVSSSNINKDKTISPSSNLEESENLNLKTNNNLSKKSMGMSSIIESNKNKNDSALKTKLYVKVDNNTIGTNGMSNIQNSDVSELPIKTTENKTIDESTGYNDELTLLLESLPVYDKTEKSIKNNYSPNYTEKKTSNLNNSKELNKTVQNVKNDSSTNVKHTNKNICSANMVVEIVSSSDDDTEVIENQKKLDKNSEQISDSSFGKPQYESTPWNSSKSTRAVFIPSTNAPSNETTCDESTINADCEKEKRHSLTPIPQEEWSQMMKEFNESVKKASISQTNNTNAKSASKVLFAQSKFSEPITKEYVSNGINMKNTANTKFKLTSNLSNDTVKTSNEFDLTRRSTRSNSKRVLKETTIQHSPKIKKKRSNYFEEQNDSELTSFNELFLSKNNSFDTKTTINETKTTAMTKKSETKNLSDNITSDVIPKFKKSISRQVKKPLLTHKANSNIQNLTSDDNNSDTDSSSTGTLRMSTRTKKIRKKNKNSIKTETSISTKKEPEAKIVLNNMTSNVKKPYVKKTMPKSNKSYPKRNATKNVETKDKDLVDLISNNDSSTDSNSSKSLYTHTRTRKKITKKNVSPELSSTKHLRARGNKSNSSNKSIVKSASRKTITRVKRSPTNSVRGSLKSENVLQLSGKTSRKKENNLNTKELKSTGKDTNQHTPSIKLEDTNSTTETKTKIDKTTKKSTQPIRITRQKSTLTDSSPLESDKTSNINKKNILKVEKISQSKKTNISKPNKKSQFKRILPSQPIKKNTTDSSEYESMSEIEEVSKKPELINNSLKPDKQKSKYKKVQNSNSSSSLPPKHNKKEIINEPSAQRPTRSRKRTADTSISQPNAKGPKLDILSTVASLTIAHVSPHNHSSTEVKRTRNMTKKIAAQVSNNSLPETTLANKKEKLKSSDKTRGKKRELESEDSSNTSTMSRKITRNTIKNSTTVKFNKNDVKKSITPKPKKIRNTKEVIIQAEKSFSAPRILRNRGKKN